MSLLIPAERRSVWRADCSFRRMRQPKHVRSFAQERFVRVRGARENNLKNIDVDVPRDALVVFTGVNTPAGACPMCHGLGRRYDVTERSLVPDDTKTIRERAIAAWPPAWHGQNLRDMLTSLGYDVDVPWRELPKKERDWILFTDETPAVPVYCGYTRAEAVRARKKKEEPSYRGNFSSAKRYVLTTFATTTNAR